MLTDRQVLASPLFRPVLEKVAALRAANPPKPLALADAANMIGTKLAYDHLRNTKIREGLAK
jgi:hypothetical protein